MAGLDELRKVRLAKKEILQNQGFSAYPVSVPRTHNVQDVKSNFENLVKSKSIVSLTGRILAIRGQGAILFISLLDAGESFQIVVKKDEISEKDFSLFVDTADIGDIVSFTGELFTTQRGENSLLAKSWAMATKSLLPLPEKWHGMEDDEERNRKRYLEMVSDNSVYKRMILRSYIVSAIRNFFDNKGFIEIETPILQSQAGGANARTFDTHHNDYDMDMVLRIAVELDHKIIMASGIERIYEIGKMFRNEGSDPSHIQEFTMIEWYAAYETLESNMTWTEDLLKHLAKDIIKKDEYLVYDKDGAEHNISFAGNWPRKKFGDLLAEYAGIDFASITDDELKDQAKKYGMKDEEINTTGRANMLDYVYKRTARPKLISPTFVTHYPGVLKPLAQQNPDGTAEVAQLIIAGMEITNQYAELVDPIIQRQLMEDQARAKDAGDEEAMSVDERFLTAMEHGMPPMTGFGMGIDRIVAILTEQKNLRDTIYFPIMRPRSE
jgi:lysyl-tRNA synthetase class 2